MTIIRKKLIRKLENRNCKYEINSKYEFLSSNCATMFLFAIVIFVLSVSFGFQD